MKCFDGFVIRKHECTATFSNVKFVLQKTAMFYLEDKFTSTRQIGTAVS